MKIEGNNLGGGIQGQVTDRTGQAGTPANVSKPDATTSTSGTTDSVVLSPELQLIQEAAKVAAAMPNVRQDVVEAMKAELAAGNIGNDPHALADALINSSLTNPKP